MSAARNSSHKLQGLVALLYRYRISSSAATSAAQSRDPRQIYNRREFESSKLGYGNYMINRGSRAFSDSSSSTPSEADGKTDFVKVKGEDKKAQPTSSAVSDQKQSFSAWAKWLLGSILTLLLPFSKQKWENLRGLEGKVEIVVEEVEVVAEVVQNVATVVEKASAEVAEKLPDNNKIKAAVLVVEHLSSVTAQEAKLTEDFIHRVGDVSKDLKVMETIVEPVIHKIVEPTNKK
ncbi:hypothetical protein ACH5RR_022409 [Cinchona calisaya]|uniref:Uncharacterized protein n=1 Tax=Cinchona calisaya TaxID=153742 RepID=A0ABD2ZBM0_9GENT